VKHVLALLVFGAVCFAAGVAYDAHAQSQARKLLSSVHIVIHQSAELLPARVLLP
jgi:hypothetical protein